IEQLHTLTLTYCFFFIIIRRPSKSTLFPYTTLFRSLDSPLGELIFHLLDGLGQEVWSIERRNSDADLWLFLGGSEPGRARRRFRDVTNPVDEYFSKHLLIAQNPPLLRRKRGGAREPRPSPRKRQLPTVTVPLAKASRSPTIQPKVHSIRIATWLVCHSDTAS